MMCWVQLTRAEDLPSAQRMRIGMSVVNIFGQRRSVFFLMVTCYYRLDDNPEAHR